MSVFNSKETSDPVQYQEGYGINFSDIDKIPVKPKATEELQPVIPERFDKNAESNPEKSPKSPVEKLESSSSQVLQKAEQRLATTEAVVDGRTQALEDRLAGGAADENVTEKQQVVEDLRNSNAELYQQARENKRVLMERASQIMSELWKTPRVNLKTGYTLESHYRKSQEAFEAGKLAHEAMLEEQRAFMEIGRDSFSAPKESQPNSREAMSARSEPPGASPSFRSPEKGKAGTKKVETRSTPESPEERHKKYKNYEAHKNSAEHSIKCLQEVKNNFEDSNDTAGALSLFENSIAELTVKADSSDIAALRGQPINLKTEKEQFGIDDNKLDDYKRMREAQNSLSQGQSVKEVVSALEKQFGEGYGLQQIDLGKIKTLNELNASRIQVNLTAESTDDPLLVGQIKEIRGVGYHIPDVPQYDVKGALVNRFNKDVKARPRVVVYKARDKQAARAA